MGEISQTPFPKTYHKFKPVDEVVIPEKLESIVRSCSNDTARHLSKPPNLTFLVQALEKIGFRKLSPRILHGSYAIVLEANNSQMIRIIVTDKKYIDIEEKRLKDDLMLQPVATIDIPGYRIEILPKVHTLKEIIGSSELSKKYEIYSDIEGRTLINTLCKDMVKSGLEWDDSATRNIGVIRYDNKNIPLCIDPGRISIISRNYKEPLSLPYAKAQAVHRRSLGLENGHIHGVVSDAQIQELRERKKQYGDRAPNYEPNDTVYSRIADDRLYIDELASIIHQAIKAIDTDKLNSEIADKGLCCYVKHVLDERSKKSSSASVVT